MSSALLCKYISIKQDTVYCENYLQTNFQAEWNEVLIFYCFKNSGHLFLLVLDGIMIYIGDVLLFILYSKVNQYYGPVVTFVM